MEENWGRGDQLHRQIWKMTDKTACEYGFIWILIRTVNAVNLSQLDKLKSNPRPAFPWMDDRMTGSRHVTAILAVKCPSGYQVSTATTIEQFRQLRLSACLPPSRVVTQQQTTTDHTQFTESHTGHTLFSSYQPFFWSYPAREALPM